MSAPRFARGGLVEGEGPVSITLRLGERAMKRDGSVWELRGRWVCISPAPVSADTSERNEQ